MKVLILTTVMAPYRIDLFNELGKNISLTVCFEQLKDKTRNNDWYKNNFKNFKPIILKNSNKSLKKIKWDFIKELNKKYDVVIFYEYSTITSIISIFTLSPATGLISLFLIFPLALQLYILLFSISTLYKLEILLITIPFCNVSSYNLVYIILSHLYSNFKIFYTKRSSSFKLLLLILSNQYLILDLLSLSLIAFLPI